jgi:hypothetical protein
VTACLKCAMPIVVILASVVEVSASHVQVKVKNELVVTFIAGSLRSVSHEEAGEAIHLILGRFKPDYRN